MDVPKGKDLPVQKEKEIRESWCGAEWCFCRYTSNWGQTSNASKWEFLNSLDSAVQIERVSLRKTLEMGGRLLPSKNHGGGDLNSPQREGKGDLRGGWGSDRRGCLKT